VIKDRQTLERSNMRAFRMCRSICKTRTRCSYRRSQRPTTSHCKDLTTARLRSFFVLARNSPTSTRILRGLHTSLTTLSLTCCSTIASLQDGTIKATHRQWPAFFYENGVYDPDDKAKGLFRGHIAWRVCIPLAVDLC